MNYSDKSSKPKNYFNQSEKKLNKSYNVILSITLLGIIGLLVRFYYFPYEIPFTYDALDYFSYALSMSQTGHFPNNWPLVNNGWPSFVSIIFANLNSENFMDFIHTQRILSVIISVLTIIPIYLIFRPNEIMEHAELTLILVIAALAGVRVGKRWLVKLKSKVMRI